MGGGTDRIDTGDMNAKVLNYAAAITKAEGSELHIAHVMPDDSPGPENVRRMPIARERCYLRGLCCCLSLAIPFVTGSVGSS